MIPRLIVDVLAQGAFNAYRTKAGQKDFHGRPFPDWFGIDAPRRTSWRAAADLVRGLVQDGERDPEVLGAALFAEYARAAGGVDRFGKALEPWARMPDQTRENWTAGAVYLAEVLGT